MDSAMKTLSLSQKIWLKKMFCPQSTLKNTKQQLLKPSLVLKKQREIFQMFQKKILLILMKKVLLLSDQKYPLVHFWLERSLQKVRQSSPLKKDYFAQFLVNKHEKSGTHRFVCLTANAELLSQSRFLTANKATS